MSRLSIALPTLILCVFDGCTLWTPRLSVTREASPASEASLVPQVTDLAAGRILVSWQRPLKKGGYTFEMAVRELSGKWSEARTIATGSDLSMFSADLPAVAKLTEKRLLAYWEIADRRDGDPYATSIQTAISDDEGQSWAQTPPVYRDALAGQHSFLSSFTTQSGLGLLWLDAKERSQMRQATMQHEHTGASDLGSVGLRYASLDSRGRVQQEAFVNAITCECCPTSAAISGRGPLAVYRGRQEAPGTLPSEVKEDRPTVRDIYITRLEGGGGWTKPRLVHADNWVINACPDNGPAVDAVGNEVVVAWWTRAGDQPKVQLAFSSDAGDTFGDPIRIDSGKGEGQVTVTLLPQSKAAVVGWLEDGKTWAKYVSLAGSVSRAVALGTSPHHSRLPHWVALNEREITAVWTSGTHDHSHVEVSRITLE